MSANRAKLAVLFLSMVNLFGCGSSSESTQAPATEPTRAEPADSRPPWTATLTAGDVTLKDEKHPEQGEQIVLLVDIKLPDGFTPKNLGGLLEIKDSGGLQLFRESIVLEDETGFSGTATKTLELGYRDDNQFRRPLKHDKNLSVTFTPASALMPDGSVQNFPQM